jgi:hypothetical protein
VVAVINRLGGTMERIGLAVFSAVVGVFVVAGMLGAGGCSRGAGADLPVASDRESYTTSTTVGTARSQAADVFTRLAAALEPVPVFGLGELPSGVTVASNWWPVLDGGSAATAIEVGANPHIVGQSEAEPEGQVVLQCGKGWLDIVANFRGDLGDASGELVGSIAGSAANLYEVNGGMLVQWSYRGRWYGVFGLDVPRDVVTSVALSMSLVERY